MKDTPSGYSSGMTMRTRQGRRMRRTEDPKSVMPLLILMLFYLVKKLVMVLNFLELVMMEKKTLKNTI
jgi:hypothetical protein